MPPTLPQPPLLGLPQLCTHYYLSGEGTVGTKNPCPSAKLPDLDEPGDEIAGDPGGDRRSRGDENRLGGEETETDGDPGGDSPSMEEKNPRRGEASGDPDSDPPSLAPTSRCCFRRRVLLSSSSTISLGGDRP